MSDEMQSATQRADAPPALFTAIQEQLGLKLVSTKASVDKVLPSYVNARGHDPFRKLFLPSYRVASLLSSRNLPEERCGAWVIDPPEKLSGAWEVRGDHAVYGLPVQVTTRVDGGANHSYRSPAVSHSALIHVYERIGSTRRFVDGTVFQMIHPIYNMRQPELIRKYNLISPLIPFLAVVRASVDFEK